MKAMSHVGAQSETAAAGATPVRIVAADEVAAHLRGRGESLYLWSHVHGVCEGKVTLLQVDTERPSDMGLRFERIGADGFDVFLAIGSLLWPEFVELELHGRKKQIRAYWNGQASVG
jgi:hypothetical protein